MKYWLDYWTSYPSDTPMDEDLRKQYEEHMKKKHGEKPLPGAGAGGIPASPEGYVHPSARKAYHFC